ncbi:MAG: glycosyltransferase family 2 protein [Deltaproteobacteria bacterium]|nr:glycosyltransferase family 2 protein [Deltaproteobacteria bacterium]
MSKTVTVFIPTLNEIDGMQKIMPRIRQEWCDQILIVDGGSTDGTVEYALAQGYEVILQKKRGIRHAYIEGLPHVKGDIVISFSPDGNSIPELIPSLVAKMREGYDMVIASRYFKNAHSEDDTTLTAFGNWMFTRLINGLHGGKYTDAMVIFRAYRKKIFYRLDLDQEAAYHPERLLRTVISIEPLLSVRAAKMGLKTCDIAGDEPPRIGGERKLLPFRWGMAYLLQTLREIYYWP